MTLKPNKLSTFILFNNKQYYIPAECSFSQNDSWQTTEKKSTDGSNSVQNITILQKKGRQPKTYTLSFNRIPLIEGENVWNLIADYEELIGKEVSLYYSGYPFRGLLITDGNFTITTDGIHGISRLSISYNLKESIVVTPLTKKVTTTTRATGPVVFR